jgi:hypothetical protein
MVLRAARGAFKDAQTRTSRLEASPGLFSTIGTRAFADRARRELPATGATGADYARMHAIS